MFGGIGPRVFGTPVYPPVNLGEYEDNIYVEAELPGFKMKDLDITLTGENELSVKGERRQPESEKGTWHRQERGYGSFSRIVQLPEHVNANKVSAEFKLGVLTVTLPKREESKPRRIEIKIS